MRFSFKYLGFILMSFFFVSTTGLKAGEKKFIVVIDPGHGGKDPGAIGSVLKLKEKNINLTVALELGSLLESEKDVEVIYTRKTDVFIPLDERPRIANKAKADLFISIHTNSAKSKAAFGTETFVIGSSSANIEVAMRENAVILYEDDYQTRYEGFDPNSSESYIMFDFMQFTFLDHSLHLAACVQDELKTTGKREDRGVKQAGFLVLKQASMPSVLVELGYISNANEEKYLNKKANQKKLAEAIYNAFLAYKTSYEKKSGIIVDETKKEEPATLKNETKPSNEVKKTEKAVDEICYRVQFYTSSKRKPLNSKEFKNFTPVKEYLENGVYKYMYGESASYTEIVKKRKEIQKHFSDAFIVVFKNEKRLSPTEARAYFK